MEQHEDDDDSLTNGLHRTFKQDVEVLESVVNAIMDAEGDADPAIFKKAQVIVVKKICSLIHTLMTVCSYKTVVKFFPHQAADLEVAVGLLEQCEEEVVVGSILKEESTGEWETKCCLLLWLSILVLIPFDLASVDTSLADPRAADTMLAGDDEATPMVQKIINICTIHLENPGPSREMAGVLLSRLLTRPDMRGALRRFMAWAHDTLASPLDSRVGVFLVPGVIMAIAAIFKVGGRDILLDIAPSAWQEASKLARSQSAIRSPLLRKLLVKLIQRIGNTYLPPRIATWRYMRGSRSLIQNLTAVSEDTNIDIVHSKNDKSVAPGLLGSSGVDTEVSEDDIEIPEIMEEVIEFLLAGLRDKDTVVRWSAAKGVGRVTGRLTLSFADDVVASVLDLFQSTEGDGAWHGGCLALAELTRRGLLLPERLPAVVPVIVKIALLLTAAAYVCWAFVRAYSSAIMNPHFQVLAPALLSTACYDREVNCRRAAASAFQEGVGRQGDYLHGIDIVNAADYFSLGSRGNAYRSVGPFVAQFDEYRLCLIEELLSTKIRHWDRSLRELAAEGLAALVKYDPGYFETTVLGTLLPWTLSPDLGLRHGAALAAAEVIRALHECGYPLKPDREKTIAAAVPAIEKARLYRGKGGEIVRSAVSRLIEVTAKVKIRLSPKIQKSLHDTLDENLKHPNSDIQAAAVAALKPFIHTYLLPASATTVTRSTGKYVQILKADPNPSAKRGAALAFTALPGELLAPVWKDVICTLSAATIPEERVEDQDAETRMNAVRGLAAVCETLYGGPGESLSNIFIPSDALVPHKQLTLVIREEVMEVLFKALEDYAVDNRGDVGSWVREAAMDALKRCSFLLCLETKVDQRKVEPKHSSGGTECSPGGTERSSGESETSGSTTEWSNTLFDKEIAVKVVGGLAKQAVEKIDRVRDVAGRTLQQLLHSDQVISDQIPHRRALEQIVPNDTSLNWAAPAVSFPRLVQFLKFPEFRPYLLSGIVISVGGLGDSLGKVSSQALFNFLQEVPPTASGIGALTDSSSAWLGGQMVELLKNNRGIDRVIIPALKTVDVLFCKGVFSHMMDCDDKFATEILDFIKSNLKGCRDVSKLLAAINVLSHFALWREPARSNALEQLLVLLGYRYPRVRKVCAEQVYLLLIQRGDEILGADDVEIALELIGETSWDGRIEEIREKRAQLFDLFNLERPAVVDVTIRPDDAPGRRKVPRDENQSYAALLSAEEKY
uniref:Tubulin-specific chaperone D n=1 Tax=Physcomitrium patens TaxID=3218 RepID=A0A7I4D1R8_PHYPA